MRFFFQPAEAPIWLSRVLADIRSALSDIWATALRLKDYATADLPPAADWSQGLVYDSTIPALKYSDGANWNRLMIHNGGAALTKVDDTNVTLTLGGTPANALLQATSLTLGWSGTLALARGGTGASDASGARSNLGLGTAAVKNTGTSGNNVPLLDGSNSWSNPNTFTLVGASIILDSAENRIEFKISGTRKGYINTGASSLDIEADFGNVINLQVAASTIASVNSTGLNLTSGKVLQVNGTQVVGAQGAAVADATDAASAITQLNALLARCRAHGLIAT